MSDFVKTRGSIESRNAVAGADVQTINRLLAWLAIRGASVNYYHADLVEKPRVMLYAHECRRLIAEIKYEFAAITTGYTYGAHGRQYHWQAEILGGWVQWIEDGRL